MTLTDGGKEASYKTDMENMIAMMRQSKASHDAALQAKNDELVQHEQQHQSIQAAHDHHMAQMNEQKTLLEHHGQTLRALRRDVAQLKHDWEVVRTELTSMFSDNSETTEQLFKQQLHQRIRGTEELQSNVPDMNSEVAPANKTATTGSASEDSDATQSSQTFGRSGENSSNEFDNNVTAEEEDLTLRPIMSKRSDSVTEQNLQQLPRCTRSPEADAETEERFEMPPTDSEQGPTVDKQNFDVGNVQVSGKPRGSRAATRGQPELAKKIPTGRPTGIFLGRLKAADSMKLAASTRSEDIEDDVEGEINAATLTSGRRQLPWDVEALTKPEYCNAKRATTFEDMEEEEDNSPIPNSSSMGARMLDAFQPRKSPAPKKSQEKQRQTTAASPRKRKAEKASSPPAQKATKKRKNVFAPDSPNQRNDAPASTMEEPVASDMGTPNDNGNASNRVRPTRERKRVNTDMEDHGMMTKGEFERLIKTSHSG